MVDTLKGFVILSRLSIFLAMLDTPKSWMNEWIMNEWAVCCCYHAFKRLHVPCVSREQRRISNALGGEDQLFLVIFQAKQNHRFKAWNQEMKKEMYWNCYPVFIEIHVSYKSKRKKSLESIGFLNLFLGRKILFLRPKTDSKGSQITNAGICYDFRLQSISIRRVSMPDRAEVLPSKGIQNLKNPWKDWVIWDLRLMKEINRTSWW